MEKNKRLSKTFKRSRRKKLRKGLKVSINQLRNLANELEKQTIYLNKELGIYYIDLDKKFLVGIKTNYPACSDEWELEV